VGHLPVCVSGVALSILLVCHSPAAAPPQQVDKAQQTLNTLRERLPEAILRGLERSCGIDWLRKESVKVRLFRRLSATKAKVTMLINQESILTFYLSYHEGVWTTIGHEEKCEGLLAGREKGVVDLALAIDEIGNPR